MTPRERFAVALSGHEVPGRVPHFELVFYLTMEAFGRVHPEHRIYRQWDQMEEKERELHRRDMAEVYVLIAERFEHDAIYLNPNPWSLEESMRLADIVRDMTGDRYFLLHHGDPTFSLPSGGDMEAFCYRLADEPAKVKEEAAARVRDCLAAAERLRAHGGFDGFAMCADYALNTGPFLSPAQFAEFVTPYLVEVIRGYREMGFYAIKHTDGNIMPILDHLLEARPHALHSLDPQGGVDIAEVKRLAGGKVALCGNVNCALMDTGTDEEVIASARYALSHGMPGGGYVFSTSNCVYTGMRLSRYELILDVWRRHGNYPGEETTGTV